MPTFRDMWIWKESHQLMLEIHQFAKTLPREERFRKRDQIERSSASVPDNIAEGYTAYYYNDKIKGVMTARKEAGETQNDDWINRYERIIAGINSYVNYVREKREHSSSKGQGKSSRIIGLPDNQNLC